MATSTPANANSPANISPVGPPPAITTASSVVPDIPMSPGRPRQGPTEGASGVRALSGGASGIRTRDLLAASQALSQRATCPAQESLGSEAPLCASRRPRARPRDVAPELLETVVLTRLGGEDVQDDVQVVGEDQGLSLARGGARAVPPPSSGARGPRRRSPWSAAGSARAEDEEVRVRAHRPHVEDDDVGGELLLGEGRDSARVVDGRQRPGIS